MLLGTPVRADNKSSKLLTVSLEYVLKVNSYPSNLVFNSMGNESQPATGLSS